MAFTQSDLDSLKAAKLELALGQRVVKVEIGGKTIEYQAGGTATIDAAIAMVEAEVAQAAGTVATRTYAKCGRATS